MNGVNENDDWQHVADLILRRGVESDRLIADESQTNDGCDGAKIAEDLTDEVGPMELLTIQAVWQLLADGAEEAGKVVCHHDWDADRQTQGKNARKIQVAAGNGEQRGASPFGAENTEASVNGDEDDRAVGDAVADRQDYDILVVLLEHGCEKDAGEKYARHERPEFVAAVAELRHHKNLSAHGN